MANVRWKDKNDITALASGDRMPVTDVSDTNVDKYYTSLEMQTFIKGFVNASDVTENSIAITPIGQQTIWMPAAAMEVAVTTVPAASNAVEIGTSLFAARTLDFSGTVDEYAYFGIQMPKGWDVSEALVLQFCWSNSGTTGNTVAWGAAATALSDDGVLTTAFSAPSVATADTNSTTADDLMISAEVSVTVNNSPAKEDYVMFEIMRDISADTLEEDARLHGVKVHYVIDLGTDA